MIVFTCLNIVLNAKPCMHNVCEVLKISVIVNIDSKAPKNPSKMANHLMMKSLLKKDMWAYVRPLTGLVY